MGITMNLNRRALVERGRAYLDQVVDLVENPELNQKVREMLGLGEENSELVKKTIFKTILPKGRFSCTWAAYKLWVATKKPLVKTDEEEQMLFNQRKLAKIEGERVNLITPRASPLDRWEEASEGWWAQPKIPYISLWSYLKYWKRIQWEGSEIPDTPAIQRAAKQWEKDRPLSIFYRIVGTNRFMPLRNKDSQERYSREFRERQTNWSIEKEGNLWVWKTKKLTPEGVMAEFWHPVSYRDLWRVPKDSKPRRSMARRRPLPPYLEEAAWIGRNTTAMFLVGTTSIPIKGEFVPNPSWLKRQEELAKMGFTLSKQKELRINGRFGVMKQLWVKNLTQAAKKELQQSS